jgi:molecular chaperone GrpE
MQAILSIVSLAGMVTKSLSSDEAQKDQKEIPESENYSSDKEETPRSVTRELREKLGQLTEDLQAERKKTTDLVTRLKYLQADLVNMQKHEDRMLVETRAQVKITWLMEIVSIKEDLDRALKVVDKTEDSSLARGLVLVNSRILSVLKGEDVRPIQAEAGKNFDPSIHEAVAFQDSDEYEQGKIISMVSPGYTVGGKVIKPALVEVARKKASRHEKKSSVPPEEVTIREENLREKSSPQL